MQQDPRKQKDTQRAHRNKRAHTHTFTKSLALNRNMTYMYSNAGKLWSDDHPARHRKTV